MIRITVQELLTQGAVQDRLSDSLETGYETDELIAWFNDALNFVWHVLIRNKYYEVIGDITLATTDTAIPSDWYKVTNQAPVIVADDKITCYGALPMSVRYYKKPPLISDATSDVVLKNWGLLDLTIQIMIVLAMSNHGFDMQTESDFAQAIASLL